MTALLYFFAAVGILCVGFTVGLIAVMVLGHVAGERKGAEWEAQHPRRWDDLREPTPIFDAVNLDLWEREMDGES